MLDAVELSVELLDVLGARAVGFLHGRGVLAGALGARDLLGGRILLTLESFDFRDQPSPSRLERDNLLESLIGIEAAVAQTCTDCVDIVANEAGVEHDSLYMPALPCYDRRM